MAVETHSFNIIILKTVGEISEKKIKLINQLGYQFVTNMNNIVCQFIEISTGNTLLITPTQIVYGAVTTNLDDIMANPEKALIAMELVLDALLLDNDYTLQVKLERSYDSQLNTLEKASSFINNHDLMFSGATSVGFRIPFIRESYHGEVKIEPFFNNHQRFFLECIIQAHKNYSQLSESMHILKLMVNAITEEFEPLAIKAFS